MKSDPLIDRLLGSFVSGEGNGSVVMGENYIYVLILSIVSDTDIQLFVVFGQESFVSLLQYSISPQFVYI